MAQHLQKAEGTGSPLSLFSASSFICLSRDGVPSCQNVFTREAAATT